MHIRFSTVVGMPIVSEHEGEALGNVSGILIHPDTGKIEGLFVAIRLFLATQELFLLPQDILHFGKSITIRDADRLATAEEIVRIVPLLRDVRKILRQRIISEKTRTNMGICADIQFDTLSYKLEWLFPRRFFFRCSPIPSRDVIEVTEKAVIVREPLALQPQLEETNKETSDIHALPEAVATFSSEDSEV